MRKREDVSARQRVSAGVACCALVPVRGTLCLCRGTGWGVMLVDGVCSCWLMVSRCVVIVVHGVRDHLSPDRLRLPALLMRVRQAKMSRR